jgi:oligopeptide/dipeptide ABC transporter ATP-binding protein
MSDTLLQVHNLTKYFSAKNGLFSRAVGFIKAVDDVSFDIHSGETLGLVGESGCGKTTLGRTILRLVEPTSGRVIFSGKDITAMSPKDLRAVRRDMQIIFQDPFSSLNPRLTLDSMLDEIIRFHKLAESEDAVRNRIDELLELVGLSQEHKDLYPHEFSGGQRQRIGIARALSVQPKFIVCDEPVSALDVSIQAQILNLLQDLQEKLGLTYLFVAHDLSVVRHISDRVAVMYLGRLVELAESESLFDRPKHPYTEALLSAIPVPDPDFQAQRIILRGEVPNPADPPSGCYFHPRCHKAMENCSSVEPQLAKVGENGLVRCLLYKECFPVS